MNPKEVSYSHPQLPLCDTPDLVPAGRLPGSETLAFGPLPGQYRFVRKRKISGFWGADKHWRKKSPDFFQKRGLPVRYIML